MPKATVNLSVEDAYAKLKEAITKRGGTVTSEKSPDHFVVKQGSLWGLSPKTAKKTVEVTFERQNDKIAITYNSKLASDWKNITIIGCILALILAVMCVWMALDLNQLVSNNTVGFWSWIVTFNGIVEVQAAETFISLSWGLAAFLSIVIALEAVIYVYAGRNIEGFAKEAIASVT